MFPELLMFVTDLQYSFLISRDKIYLLTLYRYLYQRLHFIFQYVINYNTIFIFSLFKSRVSHSEIMNVRLTLYMVVALSHLGLEQSCI